METTRKKIVFVASGSCPDRAIALERLLRSAADRLGWGERLEIRLGGIDGGAGRISDAGLTALKLAGVDAAGAVCPDLERRRELLQEACVVVCDRGDIADALVDWKEAGEAQFLCVSEIGGGEHDDHGDYPDLPISEDVREYLGAIDEVLRRVIAS